MTRAETVLAERFLKLAADHFSNHGCNDVDDEMLAGLSAAEMESIEHNYNHWNAGGDPEQWVKFQYIGDSAFMSYLADRLDVFK